MRNGTEAVAKNRGPKTVIGPAIDTAAAIRRSRSAGWNAASVVVRPPNESPITPMRSASIDPRNGRRAGSHPSTPSITALTSPGWFTMSSPRTPHGDHRVSGWSGAATT
jgi:hypothetical protein